MIKFPSVFTSASNISRRTLNHNAFKESSKKLRLQVFFLDNCDLSFIRVRVCGKKTEEKWKELNTIASEKKNNKTNSSMQQASKLYASECCCSDVVCDLIFLCFAKCTC